MDEYSASPARQSAPSPRILLTATNRWSLAARLASGFVELDSIVAAVCPINGHPLRKVRGVARLYEYGARNPLKSLRAAIQQFAPDLIVPVCDRSVMHLHQLHAQCAKEGVSGRNICSVIERSLGQASSFSVVSSRYDLMMLSKGAGIRIPETIRVDSLDDLRQWEDHLPCLLKSDGSSCGLGVKRVGSIKSGAKILRQLTRRLTAVGLISRLLFYRDRGWTISKWAEPSPGMIAQAIVAGRPANCTAVCWKGKLLAGIAVEVIQTDGPCEPAIVVEIVEGREMLEAARKIADQLHLSGFFGLDFMIEEGTGAAYLIEMNPRCAPPCSLNLGGTRDLLGAIWSELINTDLPNRPAVTDKRRIAYFPTAVLRGIAEMGQSGLCYLDIPIGQPELVEELLHPWSEMNWAGTLLYWIRRHVPFKRHIRHLLGRDRVQASSATLDDGNTGRANICAPEVTPQNDWR